MADCNLDAILYPLRRSSSCRPDRADQFERNGTLSNGTGFPAVTFPAGFSTPTASAPLGVPVGAELLGLDYTRGQAARLRLRVRAGRSAAKTAREHAALANEP